jgi:hypothetical protein
MNRARNALTGEIRNFHAGGDKLEFDERVREDLYSRFGPGSAPDCQPDCQPDPVSDAQAVLAEYGHLLN